AWQAHAPLRRMTRLRVLEVVARMLDSAVTDETWNFSVAEQTFGAGEAWPAFALSDERTNVALRGTIDRIDRAHDGRSLRIIDYKRSEQSARAAAADIGETTLQVPLYAAAASRHVGLRATGLYIGAHARSAAADPSRPREKFEARI